MILSSLLPHPPLSLSSLKGNITNGFKFLPFCSPRPLCLFLLHRSASLHWPRRVLIDFIPLNKCYIFFIWNNPKILFTYIVDFFFLESHPRHIQVPRLGVKSELQLWTYTYATAMQDPRCICDLHCSSWQCRILNALSGTRDRTSVLVDTTQVRYH